MLEAGFKGILTSLAPLAVVPTMTESPKKPLPNVSGALAGGPAAADRADRRAKALRENLLKRKAQGRQRSDRERSEEEKR
jgi:hypothetical protein